VLVAKSNAGIPEYLNGELTYSGTPEVMAEHAVRVRALGATIIGACCGSTPRHIQAMAAALKSNPEGEALRAPETPRVEQPARRQRRRKHRR
jgi:hypothetical protein